MRFLFVSVVLAAGAAACDEGETAGTDGTTGGSSESGFGGESSESGEMSTAVRFGGEFDLVNEVHPAAAGEANLTSTV